MADSKTKDNPVGKPQNRTFDEFECPDCSADNPGEPFRTGEEVRCNYCGQEFKAEVDDEGRLKLKSS